MVSIKRGNLALTLNRLRQLADQEYANPSDTVRRGRRLYQHLRTSTSEDDSLGQNKSCCPSCSSGPAQRSDVENSQLYCGSCSTAISETVDDADENSQDSIPAKASSFGERNLKPKSANRIPLTGSALVMRNFRELLWYWQEYYLRRGRDRLSIEFSCHIPFRYWLELVGKFLCVETWQ